MADSLLTCKVCCNYHAKQLHQHLKKEHNMNADEYRLIYGEDCVMQLGFNPKRKSKDDHHSTYVKKGYAQLTNKLELVEPYTKEELKAILENNNLWKRYIGKTKYRSLIKEDIRLYKSIESFTKHLNLKLTLENKMKFIVQYNYDIESARCSCKRKYTFGKHCRYCSEHKRLAMQKQIEAKIGLKNVNYNKDSISILKEVANRYGVNDLQHAENGGEYRVSGYYLDGYSPSTNTAFEYDEKHHFKPDGYLKEKDVLRQSCIQRALKCKFIRIKYDGTITEHTI